MPLSACHPFLALFLAAYLTHIEASAPEPAAAMDLLTMCGDPLLVEALYHNPTRIVSGVSENGAVSVNSDWEKGNRADWFIEQQRYGKAKTFDYKALAQAAVVTSGITGDTRYTDAARRAMIACGWLPAVRAAAVQ